MRLLPLRVHERLTIAWDKSQEEDQIFRPTHAAPPNLVTDSISVEPPGQIVAYDAWTAHTEEVVTLRKG
jgi:hypothetical protein